MFRSILLITLIALSFNGMCNAAFERPTELIKDSVDLEGWELVEITHARENDISNVGEAWIVSGKFRNVEEDKVYNLNLGVQVYDKFGFTEVTISSKRKA